MELEYETKILIFRLIQAINYLLEENEKLKKIVDDK